MCEDIAFMKVARDKSVSEKRLSLSTRLKYPVTFFFYLFNTERILDSVVKKLSGFA